MVCEERMLHKSHILILSFIGTPFNLPVLDAEFSRLAFPETLFYFVNTVRTRKDYTVFL